VLLTAGLQLTVPVYCAASVIAVTGAAPNTGAANPGIAAMSITVSATGLGQPNNTIAISATITEMAPSFISILIAIRDLHYCTISLFHLFTRAWRPSNAFQTSYLI
jgi:hypothetical protein